MKNFYSSLFTILLSGGVSNAQLTLTKAINEPVIGDVEVMKSLDSTSAIPKNTGPGQVWNFTSLNVGTFNETKTYMAVNATPQGSLFPNATIASTRGGNEYEYMKSAGSDFDYLDSTNTPTESMTFTNTALFFSWPISLGSTYTDLFSGPQTSGSVTSSMSGTISLTATGTGTVMLPGGNTQTNCLQLKRVIVASIVSGTTTSGFSETDYVYYSNAIKFPILIVNYSNKDNSLDASIMANVSMLPVGLNEMADGGNNLMIYPNPASDKIIITGIESAELNVFSFDGKKLISEKNTNVLYVQDLDAGIYFVEIKKENSSKILKFIKD